MKKQTMDFLKRCGIFVALFIPVYLIVNLAINHLGIGWAYYNSSEHELNVYMGNVIVPYEEKYDGYNIPIIVHTDGRVFLDWERD